MLSFRDGGATMGPQEILLLPFVSDTCLGDAQCLDFLVLRGSPADVSGRVPRAPLVLPPESKPGVLLAAA